MIHTLKLLFQSLVGMNSGGGKKKSKGLNWNREYDAYCIFIEISLRRARLLALKPLMVPEN